MENMKKIINFLILAIIFCLPGYLVRFNIFNIPTTFLEMLIYLTFVLTIYQNISNKIKISNYLFVPMILFIAGGAIGVFISPEKQIALGQFKACIFDPIIFLYIFISSQSDRNQIKISAIVNTLLASASLVALHAIWQKISGQATIDNRVVGIFGYSPNYLAMYLAPIAVFAISYLFNNYIKDKKVTFTVWFNAFAIILIMMALYFSGSRAGIGIVILCVMLNVIVLYWKQINSNKIYQAIFYLFIICVLIGSWWMIKPNYNLSPETGGRITASNNIRWEIWNTSMKILVTNNNWLWGVGLGNYQNYFTNFTKGWVNYDEYISPNALTAHNVYLQTWFNLGIIGLIAFIWIIYKYFKKIDKSLIYLPLLLTMVCLLLYGLVDTIYWKNDLSIFFWLLLALPIIYKENNA